MNYAVISAVKHRHFKIKGNLMNEPEKITMICFIKMNARIGVIKSINPKTADFPIERLEEMKTAFDLFKKEALRRKKAVKAGTTKPTEFTDWLYQQSNIILKLSEI